MQRVAAFGMFCPARPAAGAFARIHIDFAYGKRSAYASQRIHLAWTPKPQKIQRDRMLNLGYRFFRDHGKVVWDVADVWPAPIPATTTS